VSGVLRLACIDTEAPPLFLKSPDGIVREGYEPDVARVLAAQMGRELQWAIMPWSQMLPAVQRHEVDAVLCGQGIIASREEQVDFTRPYGVFHEGVLVRSGSGITSPADLVGRKVAAIADSANMALLLSFEGAIPVPFGGDSDDVFAEMLGALDAGEVDRLLASMQRDEERAPQLKIALKPGDSVKIKEGPLESFEGKVDEVIPAKGIVRVTVTIFGRETPVELEYWQVESI